MALSLLFGLSLLIGCFLAFPSHHFSENQAISKTSLKPRALSAFTGALSPKHEVSEILKIPGIENELVLLGPNGRVDCHQREYFLKTSGSRAAQTLYLGDQFFLDYENGLLALTREEKPLSLKMVDATEDTGIFEVRLALDDSNPSTYHLELQISRDEAGAQDYARDFVEGRALGADQLILEYGGEEFKAEKGAFRVMLGGKIYHLQQNDVYLFKDHQWIQSSPHMETRGFPMMVVDETNAMMAQLTFWDEKGVCQKKATLMIPSSPQGIDLGIRIDQIKKRTENRISCRIDARRLVLKKGDWLVKQAHGWRLISGREEMERCIQGIASGDLFVFDGVQKGLKGEVLKGTLFDSAKMYTKPISIPITESK